MKRLNLFKYGLTALMMVFAMTLCYSCSSDNDDETNQEVNPPFNGESEISGTINGHDYVELAGIKWATENVGEVEGVEAIEVPHAKPNEWVYYYYTQYNAVNAAESWGGTWTLPTKEQWEALSDENKCTWTWQNYFFNGKMSGYIVSDVKDASKFIFLPAAGFCGDGESGVYDQRHNGCYWSSDDARYLDFGNDGRSIGIDLPSFGMAVRPVAN